MTTTVRFFAGAAEAAGIEDLELVAATLGDLRAELIVRLGPDFAAILERCSLLVDGVRRERDDVPVIDAYLVDVLPPFAGG